jgi:hypothetical protein
MQLRSYIFLFLFLALCRAQAQDTIVIDAKVGKVIDLPEKNHFRLFPYYSPKIFIAASFIRSPDDVIILEAKLKNDSSAKKLISKQEFQLMRRIIEQSEEMPKPVVYHQKKIESMEDTVFVPSRLKKNVVYGTISIVGIGAAITGNLERMIKERRRGMFKTIWIKASGGAYAVWGSSGQLYGLSLTALSGKGTGHLEVNLGLSMVYEKSEWQFALSDYKYAVSIYGPEQVEKPKIRDYARLLPGLAVGYRGQSPDGHFVFRTGFCLPEFLYLSLGFCL